MPGPPVSACPDDEALDAFVRGAASEPDVAAIEAHIATCAVCGGVVRALSGGEGDVALRETVPLREAASLAAPEVLPPGAHVGRYVIESVLGAGAMGVVYAARDPALDRRVAVKRLRQGQGGDSEGASRLVREGKAMARLSHSNVVAVYDVGESGGCAFVAMELIEGRTLREWLAEAPRSVDEVLDAFVSAGRGVAAAHEAGLVHRDFKPDNVLVRRDGRVCVGDFGLARAPGAHEVGPEDERAHAARVDEPLTLTGAIVGTPAYMALEQLEGRGVDARSDIFAFCVALYEALYGERPFAARDLVELHQRVRAGEVRPAPPGAHVSPAIRHVILEGLRPDAAARPSSIAALLAALAAARRPPPARSRAAAWRLSSGAVVAALLGAVAWRRAHPPPRPPPVASVRCQSARACVERAGGAPSVCRASDGACVALASPDCTPLFEPDDLAADDTVWLGALFPATGPMAAAYGEMNRAGADFARAELAAATRALHEPGASLRVRRVALVACDESRDAARAARHLVDDVGVPAILGVGAGQEVIDLAGSLLIQRGVLTVASITPSPLITRIPQSADLPPMVWRTTFSLDDMARATADALRGPLAPPPARERLVLLREEGSASLSFAEAFQARLGGGAPPGDRYHPITVARGAAPGVFDRAADDAVAASPGAVVLLGGAEATTALVAAVESRWPSAAPRPRYIVVNDSLSAFAPWAARDPERRRRLLSVASDASSMPNARFVLRYNDAHAERVEAARNPATSYDAFYLLAYGAYALGDAAVTGPSLARVFARLVPPGTPVEVGPTHVFEALTALAAGRGIDLEGAASDLDFDLTTGEAPADFEILCTGDAPSGLIFRAKDRRWEGTLRCP